MAYAAYVSRVIDGDTFETRAETIRIANITQVATFIQIAALYSLR